eukprot:gene5528-7055_t
METYRRIARARFSIALPGLGYDTFRVWESLTMGTIPILERGIGLDKTLWRLPALLVDDFDLVTPALLHTAYVEALYRAPEFEFERLTQSFWWTFIMNVSRSSSIDTVLDKFPRYSEDATLLRPFERFTCHETQSVWRVAVIRETTQSPRSYVTSLHPHQSVSLFVTLALPLPTLPSSLTSCAPLSVLLSADSAVRISS